MGRGPGSTPRRQSGSDVIFTAVFLAVVVAFLAVARYVVITLIGESVTTAEHIRHATELASDALQAQVDEETAIRGFTITHDRQFLAPYEEASGNLGELLASLESELQASGASDGLPRVAAMRSINAEWNATIAVPIISDRVRDRRIQQKGKALVDRFRGEAADLRVILEQRAAEVNAQTSRRLALNLIVAVIATLVVILFGTLILRRMFVLQAAVGQERRLTGALQDVILQRELPRLAALHVDAYYAGAEEEAGFGGDWYDVYRLPDGRVLFSIGDITGHGLEAAIGMARVRQSIASLGMGESDPARTLERANEAMFVQGERLLATAICGYIDPHGGEIRYATAGHPPPILVAPGRAPAFLDYEGLPLGVERAAVYPSFILDAPPESMLVLYTDGLLEFDRDLAAAQPILLAAANAAYGASRPAAAIKSSVLNGRRQRDDIAVLTLRLHPSGEPVIEPAS